MGSSRWWGPVVRPVVGLVGAAGGRVRDAERPPVGGRRVSCVRVDEVVRPQAEPPVHGTRQHASRLAIPSRHDHVRRTGHGGLRPQPHQSTTSVRRPMSPVRVDLTMRLAEGAGRRGGGRLLRVAAPIASDDVIATVHDPGLIDAVVKAGSTQAPTSSVAGSAPTTTGLPGMHQAAAHIVGASVEAFRQVWSGDSLHSVQHHRRAPPRDARPRQQLLHLQRHRDRHISTCSTRAPSGSPTSFCRRPPRGRRQADLLERPPGAHDLAAQGRARCSSPAPASPGPRRPGRRDRQ